MNLSIRPELASRSLATSATALGAKASSLALDSAASGIASQLASRLRGPGSAFDAVVFDAPALTAEPAIAAATSQPGLVGRILGDVISTAKAAGSNFLLLGMALGHAVKFAGEQVLGTLKRTVVDFLGRHIRSGVEGALGFLRRGASGIGNVFKTAGRSMGKTLKHLATNLGNGAIHLGKKIGGMFKKLGGLF